jgi:peptide-methionine (R)-S-oxide reductase
MHNRLKLIPRLLLLAALALCQTACTSNSPAALQARAETRGDAVATGAYPVRHSEAEWKSLLPSESYDVLRQAGTERPFTGKYAESHADGDYRCIGCGNLLFHSNTKFDSGTGWPSFWQPASKQSVIEKTDRTLGVARTEVLCSQCGGHLGHVFDDGPRPTGLRYCMNSAALKFEPKS